MVRQAHNYLVGAFSGVTLIGIAIAVFVFLVSAQVFHDWPVASLGGHNDSAAVAPAKALPGSNQTADAAPTVTTAPAAPTAAAAVGATAGSTAKRADRHHAASTDATGPATVVEAAPDPTTAGDEAPSGEDSTSQASQPSSSSTNSTPDSDTGSTGGSTSSAGTGGSSTSSSGSSNSATGSSGSSGAVTGTTTAPPVAIVNKPAEAIAGTVNGTVGAVNEATGGTLTNTGVAPVVEQVVGGVVGPESVVGKTVDGVGESVNKLLGGGEG
jgi:hypothetical protein